MSAQPATPAKPHRVLGVLTFVAGFFTKNLGAKIAALFLSVLVWFTVRQDITEPFTKTARVQVTGLALEGLMLVEPHTTSVIVTFAGPTGKIDEIRRSENAEVRLRVRKADLLGNNRWTLSFSLSNGNVEHIYGDEIEIREMEPAEVKLVVAVRAERKLPVKRPEIEGELYEWTLSDLTLDRQEITVTGPKDRIDALTEVAMQPIRAEDILNGNGEEERLSHDGWLRLDEDLEKQKIQPFGNERVRYHAEFRRTRATREISLPYVVKYETTERAVLLRIIPGRIVQRQSDGAFTIKLTFRGSRADLDRVETGVRDGEIRAYVRAEDYDWYVREEPDKTGNPGPIRLEMPEELRRRVDWDQPDRSEVEVRTEPK